jgi:sugar (pentulose or hexulose) kinase
MTSIDSQSHFTVNNILDSILIFSPVLATDYDEINTEVPLRAFDDELLVYPFVSGNGAYRGANVLKYSVENASYNHDKFDVIKASMEGVAFEIRQIIDEYVKGGFKVKNIIVTGGATRSSVWMKILSTVLGRKLYLSEQTDGCCLGAYSVAKKGASGEFVTFEFNGKTVEPNNDLMGKYTDKFKRYNEFLNKIR